MNKNDIKKILMSMRTPENENKVNNLLGKIDLLKEEELQKMLDKIGNNEESIKKYIQEKLKERHNISEEHTPINFMFTYGISKNSIHLHMPVKLDEMVSKKGRKDTFDTVNLYLLDAIEKIKKMQNDGFYKFEGKDSIYMISPILIGKEMKFLEELDFNTQLYSKSNLQNEDFVSKNPEAQLAIHIFGRNSNVGTAKIGLDVVNSDKWQSKRKDKVKEFEKQGIILDEEVKEK